MNDATLAGLVNGMRAVQAEDVEALLAALDDTDDLRRKEMVVRALTDKVAQSGEVIQRLGAEFARVGVVSLLGADGRISDEFGYKWALGNALGYLARPSDGALLEALVLDPAHGRGREMLVVALGRLKSERALPVLLATLDDPEVAGHAVIGLRNLGDPTALEALHPFERHENAWVRQEAKKAIKRLTR